MLTAEVISHYIGKSRDQAQTNRIKTAFAELRQNRNPMFLTIREIDRVEKWFLGSLYDLYGSKREGRTEDMVQNATREAFGLSQPNETDEIILKIRALSTIPGIDVGTSSAILGLTFPHLYCPISKIGFKRAFDLPKAKSTFTIRDYIAYLSKIRQFSEELNSTPQEIDLAIWAYDRANPYIK